MQIDGGKVRLESDTVHRVGIMILYEQGKIILKFTPQTISPNTVEKVLSEINRSGQWGAEANVVGVGTFRLPRRFNRRHRCPH
jgi:nucleoid DNA-binding protein